MSYHTDSQKFIKSSKAQGRTVTREGSELIASKLPSETAPQGNRDHVIGAFHRMMDYLGGSQRVDNTANAAPMVHKEMKSYPSMVRKEMKPIPKAKQPDAWAPSSLPKNQKTFGVPGAK